MIDGVTSTACPGTSTPACCSTARDLLGSAGYADDAADLGRVARRDGGDQAGGRARPLRDLPADQRMVAPGDPRAPGRVAAARRRRHARGVLGGPSSAARSTSTSTSSASGLAPPIGDNEIANLYQEFARGYFAMYITGPWNLGEFRRRLPDGAAGRLGDRADARPRRRARASRSPAARAWSLFRGSRRTRTAAWQLVEFLSRPEQQVRFYELTGDLPARRRGLARLGARRRSAAARRSASSSTAGRADARRCRSGS